MQASEVTSANSMRCTKSMNFEALCCLDYGNFQSYLTDSGPMTLTAAQTSSATAPGGLALMEDKVVEEGLGADAPQVTICTAKSPMPPVSGSAATEGVECFTKEFSVPDIVASATASPEDGNLILNERVEYFLNQQIPLASVPLCAESVQECACNGKKPASAKLEYVCERFPDTAGCAAAPIAALAQKKHRAGRKWGVYKSGFLQPLS